MNKKLFYFCALILLINIFPVQAQEFDLDQIGQPISGYASSVDLSADGTIMAIGSPQNQNYGVKVYKNIAGTWTAMGSPILGIVKGDQTGFSVSLSSDGTVLAVSTPNKGVIKIYKYISYEWVQIG